jgi:hypothetical protein
MYKPCSLQDFVSKLNLFNLIELTLEGCMLAQSPPRLLQRCISCGELAPASRLFCRLLGWCREGESNPQDPKVGGF